MSLIKICGQSFDRALEYFIFEWPTPEILDMKEFRKLAQFPNLRGTSFASTNLNDEGLAWVCEQRQIENLCLQDTEVSSQGLRALAKLDSLKILRLKENPQIDNTGIKHLNALEFLKDLQIHETSVTQSGLDGLTLMGLDNLLISISDDNYRLDFLQNLSARLCCTILAKGVAEFSCGEATIF